MVSVTHKFSPLSGQDSINIQAWTESLSTRLTAGEIAAVHHACDFARPLYANHTELNGVALIQHALGTATILADMNMDGDTLLAAILHAVPEHLENWSETLETEFGKDVRNLVLGMSRMERIQDFSPLFQAKDQGIRKQDKNKNEQAQQIESLRKMLLAMVEDIRVVLIKLAERTQMMRSLAGASEVNQKRISHEIQGIFAPLANRLGVWQIKWELEDLALRYLEPELYKKIAKLLDERAWTASNIFPMYCHNLKMN